MSARNKVVTVGEVTQKKYHQSVDEKICLHIAIIYLMCQNFQKFQEIEGVCDVERNWKVF